MSSLRSWRLRAIRNSPVDYFSEATADRQMEVEKGVRKQSLRLEVDRMTRGSPGASKVAGCKEVSRRLCGETRP